MCLGNLYLPSLRRMLLTGISILSALFPKVTPIPRSFIARSSAKSEVAPSWTILCDPIDCSLPGSSVHGIFQARVLEWIAISFFRGSSRPRDRTQASHIADRRFNLSLLDGLPDSAGAHRWRERAYCLLGQLVPKLQ